MTKHVYIAAPQYAGTLYSGTSLSLVREILLMTDKGWQITLAPDVGNAEIAKCRGAFIAHFLGTDATDLWFLDHDIQWEPGAMVGLMEQPVDFAAGVYRHRCDPEAYSVRWVDRPWLQADPETGLLEVDGVPAGFLRLSRACCEKMVAAHPDLEFWHAKTPDNRAWHLFSDYWIDNDHGARLCLSEDYSFCHRWRDIGGKIWIDPTLKLGHCGPKTFTGSIGDWLRNRPPEQHESKEAA